jgi:hypothetical protein
LITPTDRDKMALRLAERRSRITKSCLLSDWKNELFSLGRFFIKKGIGALLSNRDGLGYHPRFVLAYEEACATDSRFL